MFLPPRAMRAAPALRRPFAIVAVFHARVNGNEPTTVARRANR